MYLRDGPERSSEDQRADLEAWARRAGYTLAGIYWEADKERLIADVRAGLIDVVAADSIDRLANSMTALVPLLDGFRSAGCDLFILRQGVDTGSGDGGRAIYQALDTFAAWQRDLLNARTREGRARARAEGKAMGRPRVPAEKEAKVRELLGQKVGLGRVAKLAGVGTGTVQRINAEMKLENGSSQSASTLARDARGIP